MLKGPIKCNCSKLCCIVCCCLFHLFRKYINLIRNLTPLQSNGSYSEWGKAMLVKWFVEHVFITYYLLFAECAKSYQLLRQKVVVFWCQLVYIILWSALFRVWRRFTALKKDFSGIYQKHLNCHKMRYVLSTAVNAQSLMYIHAAPKRFFSYLVHDTTMPL